MVNAFDYALPCARLLPEYNNVTDAACQSVPQAMTALRYSFNLLTLIMGVKKTDVDSGNFPVFPEQFIRDVDKVKKTFQELGSAIKDDYFSR